MTIKVGTELLQLIKKMDDVIASTGNMELHFGYISISYKDESARFKDDFAVVTRQAAMPVIESLEEAGFKLDKVVKEYGDVKYKFHTPGNHLMSVHVEYKGTKEDQLESLMEQQKRINEEIEKMKEKDAGSERSAV